MIGLAVPGRPIRSLVAEDWSAGGVRDRTGPEPPMLTKLLRRRAATPRGESVQDGTALRHPPSSKAWQSLEEHRPRHRMGNLGPGVRLPRALRALPYEAVVTKDGPHPAVELEPLRPGVSAVILTGRATHVP